ncbi:hypothetical protein RB595_008319 [Gaeumannomyces hyphopodioides]
MANHRHHERPGPVQTSAVYLVGRPAGPVERPPSPPSPSGMPFCPPTHQEPPPLLDDDDVIPAPGTTSPPPPPTITPNIPAAVGSPRAPASPVVTAPPSPSLRPAGWGPPAADRLASAVRVLNAEAAALASLARLYSGDAGARAAFDGAASAVARSQGRGGTLVVSGVGKSGHIARKLAATFSSLSVRAAFMHPTEALHGDLGLLAPTRDAALLVSFSGRTPELRALAAHLHPALPVVVVTAAPDGECEIAALLRSARTMRRRSGSGSRSAAASGASSRGGGAGEAGYEADRGSGAEADSRAWTAFSGGEDMRDGEAHGAPVVVLPAPIPFSEVDCLGIAAPTASTTVALALGDALAVVVGRELHGGVEGVASVFAKNHPGGAIGAAISASRGTPSPPTFDDSRPETPGSEPSR